MLRLFIRMCRSLNTLLTADIIVCTGLVIALVMLIVMGTSEQALLALATGLVGYLGRGTKEK